MHGAGGVGGDELHHHLLAAAFVHRAVGLPLSLDVSEHAAVPLAAQGKVQEAGPGDLHLVKKGADQIQMADDHLGDLAGGLAQSLGPGHGEGGGIVPVGDVLGNLDGGLDLRAGGQQALRRGLLIGRLGQSGDLLPGRLDHVGHGSISFSIHLSVCRAAGRRAG